MKAEVLAAIGEDRVAAAPPPSTPRCQPTTGSNTLSLLQMAAAHADQPEQPAASLKRERIACGIDEPGLDGFTAAAHARAPPIHMPGADKAARAHRAGPPHDGGAGARRRDRPASAARLRRALAAMPQASGDMLDAAALAAMSTAAPPAGSDSLHRLVMDLHKQLNALQAALAEETLDGAAVYGLAETTAPAWPPSWPG